MMKIAVKGKIEVLIYSMRAVLKYLVLEMT